MKNFLKVLMLAMVCGIIFAANSFAVTLLTKEQALKEMYPDINDIKTVTHTLSASEISAIKEKMGGTLVHYQRGSKSENVAEATTYEFYIGMKDNKPVRMAVIEEQPGKWGPVVFIIAIDVNTAKINNMAVMAYKEKRGRPIARNNFLSQFFGKGDSDPISVKSAKGIRKDIRAISGATISSYSACFAARKVVSIFNNVFAQIDLAQK